MKIQTKTIARLWAITLIVLTLLISLPAQTTQKKQPRLNWQKHQAEIIKNVQNHLVSDLETGLPRIRFAVWFQKTVSMKRKVIWRLAECPWQNIGSENEIKLELPLCVDSSTQISRKSFLHILIEYGTFEQGIGEKQPIVKSIFPSDKNGNASATIEMLSELPKFLRAIRKSSGYFNPNRGEFEISDKKPIGFEDFLSIWFRTVDNAC